MWPWSEIRLLKSSLRLFAGEHVLARVIEQRESALKLGGEVREVALMFLDIASFTVADEGLDSKRLAGFMNEYLEIVTECVVAHDGTIDSYTGDAVFAWWNNAEIRANANSACSCAKAIVRRIGSQNEVWSSKGLPKLQLKIGINSGRVNLGNYGTSRRIRFSALGDQVNLASRLCNLANGPYPTPIVISGNTQALLSNDIAASLLDTVRVKGKDEPVQLFSI